MRKTIVIGSLLFLIAGSVGVGIAIQRYMASREARRVFETEADAIADILQLRPDAVVADIWAGDGRWSVDLARRLSDEGHVYVVAAPTDPISEIYANLAAAELDNVTVLEATVDAPLGWLQADCCDALLVRYVYHDMPDRLAVTRQLYDEIHVGGRLALIDFEPDAPPASEGHGIEMDIVIGEVSQVGFEMTRSISDWLNDAYCVIFEKPVAAPPEPQPDTTEPSAEAPPGP